MPTYTRTDIRGRLNSGIKGKIGILVDVEQTINTAVREVMNEVDLRSARRAVDLVPGMSGTVYEYPAPPDLKGVKVIGVRNLQEEYGVIPSELVTSGEFRQYRKTHTIAIENSNGLRTLLVAIPGREAHGLVARMGTLDDGGGAWTAFGDATNVFADPADFIRGSGSINFDINNAAGTTAGLQNIALNPFDYRGFDDTRASIYSYVKISETEGITNFVLRYGDSPTVYHEVIVTTTAFGTQFVQGWNLLRFDVARRTTVGAPDAQSLEYVAIFMTKEATKIDEQGFKVNVVNFAQGQSKRVSYYTEYPWKDAITGALKLESTDDSDLLNCDSDEYDLFLHKLVQNGGMEVDEIQTSMDSGARYEKKKKEYTMQNPSEALLLTYDYQAQYYI